MLSQQVAAQTRAEGAGAFHTAVEDVAHLLVRCLRAEGVEYVFGIPGEENIRFVDALNGSGIRYVLVRHEQAGSFMAEIYGRLTGRAGVCSATLGPGAINLLLGTADAMTNRRRLLPDPADQAADSCSPDRLTADQQGLRCFMPLRQAPSATVRAAAP